MMEIHFSIDGCALSIIFDGVCLWRVVEALCETTSRIVSFAE